MQSWEVAAALVGNVAGILETVITATKYVNKLVSRYPRRLESLPTAYCSNMAITVVTRKRKKEFHLHGSNYFRANLEPSRQQV